MHRRLDLRPLVGGALIALLLVVIAALTYANTRRVWQDAGLVSHTHEVLDALEVLLSAAKDAETGQRGYLITADPSYLEPYGVALASIQEQLRRLQRLTADNAMQQARLPELGRLLDAKRAELQSTIAVARERGTAAAREIVQSGRGKAEMDALRTLVATMKGEEERLMIERTAISAHSYRVAVLSALGSTGVGLLLLAVLVAGSARSLRARAAAAETLLEQKELLRTTLASIGDAVIATDHQGHVTFVNGVAEELTGWRQDEALGVDLTSVFRIVEETTRQPVDNPALRALREGRVVGLANHTILLGKDGTERPIDDSAAPIRNAAGGVTGAVLVFRDVSEQRRAHLALQENEQRKSAILDGALDCIVTIDHEGNILEFNPACERTFGHARDAVLGRSMADILVPASQREAHREGMAKYLSTGEGPILGRRIEIEALHADGREFPIELSIVAIPRPGRPIFTAYLRDITARKESEQTIERLLARERARAERLGLVAAASATINSAMTQSSVAGVVRTEAQRILEAESAELLAEDAPPPQQQPGSLLAPLIGRGGRRIGVLRLTKADVPFEDEDRSILAQLAHMAAVAFENARLYEELRDGDRRKDEFIATLAHELRNPLAPIRNALRILRLAGGDAAVAEQGRAMIERQIEQVVRLVDDLLDVSRISRGKLHLRVERLELAPVLEAALETSRPLIEEAGHALEIALPAEPLWITGDATRLAQIFLNLLNNAAKYTRDRGRIWLTVDRDGDEAVVRVRDSGIGIPESMLSRVFDMFMQVEERSLQRTNGGLGIGLTLVKELVELHGGKVAAYSEGLDTGSEFVVRLPLAAAEAVAVTAEPPAAPQPSPGHARKRRILVVDDNRDAVESLAILLEMMDYEVRTAADGIEALDVAEAFAPDVVLLDIGLPRLNGYETAERIRLLPVGREIFLVALTGWGQEEDRRRSREAGFDHHLVKPVDPDALEALLQDHARRAPRGDART